MAIYVKYEGIDGEATHQEHKKWLDVGSLQWGVGRAISTPSGSTANREASEPSVSEVTITKLMDSSSPKFFTEACTGAIGKTVKIDLVTTGSPGTTYATYTLTNALVSAYSMSSGGDRPSESISISFTKLEFKFTPYDDKNKAGTPTTVSYDISTTKSA
ncbi:type VI secretion system tube protein Hcp [Azospirillum sp. RWY-5-1]|uniref:Type VI secretion system tube protein Hcp n=1 Tax=Azospirillum oleiclasticum TaxID=2735135 RepID=A0ABX2TKQ9_9PROT|nr:type VI secretion system tube protein Hcp [Azospirillum oleiclasticum]NYZ17600.1 type VI secretion system tube protein Hcp [Azospirillum oleiclasticum]NYZ24932.1 type VI secretion system tube protein Hcp [Azospirillum oleiclasticum]